MPQYPLQPLCGWRKSFSAPITVNDNLDAITHRFEAWHQLRGRFIWRGWTSAMRGGEKQGRKYNGIAIYYAISDDAGRSFHAIARWQTTPANAAAGDGDRQH